MTSEVPEPWASAMMERGYTYGGRPSIRALARAAGFADASETVRQLVLGGRKAPDLNTVERVAAALGVPLKEVSAWAGQTRSVLKPYRMPPEVDLLTGDEQTALTGLIRAIAKGRQGRQPIPSEEVSATVHRFPDIAAPLEQGKNAARRSSRGRNPGRNPLGGNT